MENPGISGGNIEKDEKSFECENFTQNKYEFVKVNMKIGNFNKTKISN